MAYYISAQTAGEDFTNVYSFSSSGSNLLGTTTDILLNNNRVYAFGGGIVNTPYRNLFRSTYGGSSVWTDLSTDPDGSTDGFVNDLVVVGKDTMYAAMSNGNIRKTIDEGSSSWTTKTNVGGGGTPSANTIAMNASNLGVIYAGGNGGLKKTTDYGGSWTSIRTDEVLRVVMPYSGLPHILYALTKASGTGETNVYGSGDGGSNWNDNSGNLPKPINDIRARVDAGFIYVATSKGVYSIDIPPARPTGVVASVSSSGNHPRIDWNANTEEDLASVPYVVYKKKYTSAPEEIPADPPEGSTTFTTADTYFIDASEVTNAEPPVEYPNAVYWIGVVDAGGHHASNKSDGVGFLLEGGFGEGKIAVPYQAIPAVFALHGNYPNPFNPITIIRYDVPVDGRVTIKVYDIMGREMMTLVDGVTEAGYRQVSVDASRLSSGVYFYRMQAGAFVSLKKMLVVK